MRFLCALGTHAPLDNAAFRRKLGEEVLERFPVYNHNPYENCEHLGQTRLGTPIMVNKEYLELRRKDRHRLLRPAWFLRITGEGTKLSCRALPI